MAIGDETDLYVARENQAAQAEARMYAEHAQEQVRARYDDRPDATAPQNYARNYDTGLAGTTAGYAPGTVTTGQWNTYPATQPGRPTRCARDQHFFECRHETNCDCGKTARVPVPEGL